MWLDCWREVGDFTFQVNLKSVAPPSLGIHGGDAWLLDQQDPASRWQMKPTGLGVPALYTYEYYIICVFSVYSFGF